MTNGNPYKYCLLFTRRCFGGISRRYVVIKMQRLSTMLEGEYSMYTNRKLQNAVRFALGISAGALALGASPGALAQDDEADELEEITVTGSRIKRADLDSASPVTVIDREVLLASGLQDVGNLIQRMPSMSGSPIGTTTNNGGNGSVLIDLRGMGTDRTVTLVNGRRVVDSGDYQTIPAIMVERVEILKDGASAIYGADAVAGVVNIITRQDFDGISVDLQSADFFDMKSGAQQSIGIIAGKTFADGNVLFGAEFIDQEEAFQSDAPWATFQDSYYIYPGGCEAQVTAPYDGTPSGGCYPTGSSRIPESRLGFLIPGGTIASTFLIPSPGATMVPHDGRTYNYAPVNYIQTPYERTNLFAEANFELSETVRFKGSLRSNFRESEQFLAPMPYNSPTDPAHSGTFGGEAYNGVSEDNYYLVQAIDAYNAANGTALPYEPLTDFRRRMIERNRTFTQEITQYQANIGLEGTLPNDMSWEIYYNKGYRSRVDNDFGQFSGPRIHDAFGPSADLDGDGSPECYQDVADPSTIVAQCVPFNPFAGNGAMPDEMLDYLAIDVVDSYVTTMDIIGASITGSMFELPGGEFGWAAGFGYWGNSFRYSPDSAKQLDAVTGNVGAGTDGSLYSTSYFVEVYAPLFDNDSQSLALKGGARYDEYNVFGGDTTWQFGVEFNAIESLKFRATAGTVFRAPTVTNLFGGLVDSFPTYSDPCIPNPGDPLPPGCAQVGLQLDSQLLARVGGNPFLVPETGDTLTAGVVWNQEFGETDLSVTVDYWNVEIEDGISSLGVNFILDDCYLNDNPASCALVTRRADYSIAQVLDASLNVASQTAEGIDVEVRLNLSTDVGDFEGALLWTHLLERTKQTSSSDPVQNLEGKHTRVTAQDGGTYAEDKLNYSIQWMRNSVSVGYMGEYISGITGTDAGFLGGTYIQSVDSLLYHDIVASFDFGSGSTIAAGVTNITDEEPPYIDLGFNAKTDPTAYRMFGMGYYVRFSQTFE